MNENAEEAASAQEPAHVHVEPRIGNASTLSILRSQRGMMWLFLLKIGLDFTVSMARELPSRPLQIAYLCVFVLVEGSIAYFAFRISNAIFGLGPALVCSLMTLIPCMGMFSVVILNGTVIDRLRKSGVSVGFMGATKLQLEQYGASRSGDSFSLNSK